MPTGDRTTVERAEDAITRLEDDERFERLLADENEFQSDVARMREHEQKQGRVGHATVTDAAYDADGSILALTTATPDGTERTFRVRVGDDELTTKARVLLDCLGTDRLADAIGREVPVIYTEDGWYLHLPKNDPRILYRWLRFGFAHGLYDYTDNVPSRIGRSADGTKPTILGLLAFACIVAAWVGIGAAIHPIIAAFVPISIVLFPFWRRLETIPHEGGN